MEATEQLTTGVWTSTGKWTGWSHSCSKQLLTLLDVPDISTLRKIGDSALGQLRTPFVVIADNVFLLIAADASLQRFASAPNAESVLAGKLQVRASTDACGGEQK